MYGQAFNTVAQQFMDGTLDNDPIGNEQERFVRQLVEEAMNRLVIRNDRPTSVTIVIRTLEETSSVDPTDPEAARLQFYRFLEGQEIARRIHHG